MACAQAVPQQLEHGARHVRMADHAVWLAEKLWLSKSRDGHEDPVHIGDFTFEIGFADDDVVVRKEPLGSVSV